VCFSIATHQIVWPKVNIDECPSLPFRSLSCWSHSCNGHKHFCRLAYHSINHLINKHQITFEFSFEWWRKDGLLLFVKEKVTILIKFAICQLNIKIKMTQKDFNENSKQKTPSQFC
jgi:hypothetical protein